RLSRYWRASSWPPIPKASERPSINEPNTMANATSTVCSASPNSSKPMETVRTMMIVRTVELISRGEAKSALTAANSAAREKKLAAKNPKKSTNSATNNLGRKPKNLEMCSCNPTIPSTLTPTRMNPIQATQKTKRLNSSVEEGRAALLSNWA